MRNKKLRQGLSLLLTLTMLTGLLPTAALAAPAEVRGTVQVSAEAVENGSALSQRVEALLDAQVRRYAAQTNDWAVLDMGAYQLTHANGMALTAEARQTYLDNTIDTLLSEQANDAAISKAILALTAQGIDPRALCSADGRAVNAAELLAGAEKSTSLWTLPFTLMACKLMDCGTAEERESLLTTLLDQQREDGSWDEWGTIDTTANAIAALSLYMEEERVAPAVESGLDYLSSVQMDNGSFGAEEGSAWAVSNTNSSALVVVALCAAGVDPVSDPRFLKNGKSAVDGLLTFALEDNSGFGYTDHQSFNPMADEQAFRALIACEQVARTGAPYHVYEFPTEKLVPGYGSPVDNGDGSITLTVPEDTLVCLPMGKPGQILVTVETGGAERVVKKAVVTEGASYAVLSGTVTVRMADRAVRFADVKDGDWFAGAVRFTAARDLFVGVDGGRAFAPEMEMSRAMVVTVLRSLENGVGSQNAGFEDVKSSDWFAAAVDWAREFGITSGVDQTHFAPNAVLTRQELALMLYRYGEKLGMDVSGRADLTGYADHDKVAGWAAGAMAWAVDSGVLSGVGGGRLAPAAVVTRSQAAQMMMKLVMNLVGYEADPLEEALSGLRTYLDRTVPRPQAGAVLGGDWAVIGMVRSGNALTEGWLQQYYNDFAAYAAEKKGVLHERKYTEYARAVLALTAIGADPTDVGGYDLLAPLADYEKTVWQGPNGAIWALIALNSGNYTLPQGTATEQKYVDKVLSDQLADGGWSMTGRMPSDPDLTAMALVALSAYREQSTVAGAVEKGLTFLSEHQTAEGAFASKSVANAESCGQVVIALTALDIPLDDPRFVKNGPSPLDALLTFRNPDGSFCPVQDGKANQMATEQALLALSAAWRWEHGKPGVYEMSDVIAHVTIET